MSSNKAQRPQGPPSSMPDLPELTLETFAGVMKTFADELQLLITVRMGGVEKHFELLLGSSQRTYGNLAAQCYTREVGIWRSAGLTDSPAPFMRSIGVMENLNQLVFYGDDGESISKPLELIAVNWLENFVIKVPNTVS